MVLSGKKTGKVETVISDPILSPSQKIRKTSEMYQEKKKTMERKQL